MKKTFFHHCFIKTIMMVVFICCVVVLCVGCSNQNENPFTDLSKPSEIGSYQGLESVESLYGMAFVTTSELLSFQDQNNVVMSKTRETLSNEDFNLPESGSDAVQKVQGQAETFNRYFNMLNEFLNKSSISTTLENNQATDANLSSYQYKLTIQGQDVNGDPVTHVMYYTEQEAGGYEHQEGNEVETYKGYSVEGVMEMGEDENHQPIYYFITGTRSETKEQEGNEVEISHEFSIRASEVQNDSRNYVRMTYENETEQEGKFLESENSYLYSVYQDGKIVEKTEVSFEKENKETEYEIEFISGTSRGYYEIERVERSQSTWIEVSYNIDGSRGKFVVIENQDGTYDYKFSNNESDDRLFRHFDD